jgi:hypothetical protein
LSQALSGVKRIPREATVSAYLQGSFDCAAASRSRSIGFAQDDNANLMIACRARAEIILSLVSQSRDQSYGFPIPTVTTLP